MINGMRGYGRFLILTGVLALAPVTVAGGVALGRLPSRRVAADFAAVIDLSAELPRPEQHVAWRAFPTLDLVVPQPQLLRAAAQAIEEGRARGPVLVCCALGYSRSASALATWLIAYGHAGNVATAVARASGGRARRWCSAMPPWRRSGVPRRHDGRSPSGSAARERGVPARSGSRHRSAVARIDRGRVGRARRHRGLGRASSGTGVAAGFVGARRRRRGLSGDFASASTPPCSATWRMRPRPARAILPTSTPR